MTADEPLELYHERLGEGPPLVLLHGAMGTIESCFAGLIPLLTSTFEVIPVELQAHGRSPDADRPLTFDGMARDVAALLDRLELPKASILGYSIGSMVALHLALQRPELVERLVLTGGTAYRTDGMYPQMLDALKDFDPAMMDGSPWHDAYRAVAPDPDGWRNLVNKIHDLDLVEVELSPEDLAALGIPMQLIIADGDIVRPEHTLDLFRHLGGCVPGDLEPMPESQLAIVPGTTHIGLLDRWDWITPMVTEFLQP